MVIVEEILIVAGFSSSSSVWFLREELISSSLSIWYDWVRFSVLCSCDVLDNANDDDRDSFGSVCRRISESSSNNGSIECDDWRCSVWSTSLRAFSSVVYDIESSYWTLSPASRNELMDWFSLPKASIKCEIDRWFSGIIVRILERTFRDETVTNLLKLLFDNHQ